MFMFNRRIAALIALPATAVVALAGCSGDADTAQGGDLQVLASFYPLQYVAEQVGGDLVSVSSLTPPGAEPHDLELSPRQVRDVGDADVVVVLGGFQPSVDEAVSAREPEHLVDAAQTTAVAAHMTEGEHADEEAAESEDGHDHSGQDPHFWLDPTLLAAVASDVAAAYSQADPDNADAYAERLATLTDDLTALDEEYSDGLATCERSVIVTSHEAFGFLTERYGLTQVGISGLDPEAEPSPARLREIRDVVESSGVTTIFTEVLVSPEVGETLAADLGITTTVLDPLESLAESTTDYREGMQTNLEALRTALGCA